MPLARFVRIYGDCALALGLAVLFQIEVWTIHPSHPPGDVGTVVVSSTDRASAAAAGLVFTLSLAWRQRAPLAVLAVAIATMGVASLVPVLDAAATPLVALVVAVYSVGAHAQGVRTPIGVAGVAALIAVVVPQFSFGDVLFVATIVGGAWLAGWAMRYRRERERTLERLTLDLERERDELAVAAVAEERARIARELHDVVAHAVSVIVLQARGARHADAAERDEALDAIEATGANALAEMRRLLHMLRAEDEDVALAPQPSLAHLDLLVSQVRDAGLPVELRVEGERRELPPGVDVSAYRIVQEALTNVLKHAGPAQVRVRVRYEPDALELEIADTGAGAATGAGAGHGLAGMRERVAVFGGELASGPLRDGGFEIRARLPL